MINFLNVKVLYALFLEPNYKYIFYFIFNTLNINFSSSSVLLRILSILNGTTTDFDVVVACVVVGAAVEDGRYERY